MSCKDQHSTGCQCAPSTDQEIVDQIELVKDAMFRLEEMIGPVGDSRRATLFDVRAEFCQVAFRLIGTRPVLKKQEGSKCRRCDGSGSTSDEGSRTAYEPGPCSACSGTGFQKR